MTDRFAWTTDQLVPDSDLKKRIDQPGVYDDPGTDIGRGRAIYGPEEADIEKEGKWTHHSREDVLLGPNGEVATSYRNQEPVYKPHDILGDQQSPSGDMIFQHEKEEKIDPDPGASMYFSEDDELKKTTFGPGVPTQQADNMGMVSEIDGPGPETDTDLDKESDEDGIGGFGVTRDTYKGIPVIRKQPPRPGLVPQSGNPEHPVRWIRPEGEQRLDPSEEKPTDEPRATVSGSIEEAQFTAFEKVIGIEEGTAKELITRAYATNVPGYQSSIEAVKTGKDSGFVLIVIKDSTGKKVGKIERMFSYIRGDELVVDHLHFALEQNHQNNGLAADINERAEQEYRKIGVTGIELIANMSIGGYAWARQGYDFSNSREREKLLESIDQKLLGLALSGKFSMEQGDVLRAELVKMEHPWEIAEWNPLDEPPGKHLGKYLLVGTTWNGIKSLDPNSPSFKRGEQYRQAKKTVGVKQA